jgi:hypothetical protein
VQPGEGPVVGLKRTAAQRGPRFVQPKQGRSGPPVKRDPICGHCGDVVLNANGYHNKDGTTCHISCHDGRIPYDPDRYHRREDEQNAQTS